MLTCQRNQEEQSEAKHMAIADNSLRNSHFKNALKSIGDVMKKIFFQQGLMLLLLLVVVQAQAAGNGIDNVGLFDKLIERFNSTSKAWAEDMVGFGTWLFWALVLLSMVWTYGMMILKKADLQEFFAETIRFFTITGFFLWILKNGPEIALSIIESLREIAAKSSGFDNSIQPSGIVDMGFDIASRVINQSASWSQSYAIVGMSVAIIILIVLAIISINLLLMLISAWFLAYAGVFLLGFGGGRWTSDIAITYYKAVISLGMQTFTMILIIGVGRSYIDAYYDNMTAGVELKELLVMLVASMIILFLINRIPAMLGSLVGGGSLPGGFSIGSAASTAGMAAVFAASSGASALGADGITAIKTAYTSAQQNKSSNDDSGR